MSRPEQAHTVERRPSRITLTARGEVTTAAALHRLHRPGRTEAHYHFDDAKVVETQEAEQSAENVHHRAAWRDAPKIQNWNRERWDMLLQNSFQHSQLLSTGLRARTRIGPTPAQRNRGPGRLEIVGHLRLTRGPPAGLITPQKSPLVNPEAPSVSRPERSLTRPWRTLSQGVSPPSHPGEPLVSFDAAPCYLIQGLRGPFRGIAENSLFEEVSRWTGRKSN